MSDNINFSNGRWINKPSIFAVADDSVKIVTGGGTDFWQRTYYGFRNDNAPALLCGSTENFTFTCKACFNYKERFDQAGIIIYLDAENWFKASIEHEGAGVARLGSVVTNLGYSDWATRDIAPLNSIWYRLSRRGCDFLVETSSDGERFEQLRIFHLHVLGETDSERAKDKYFSGSNEAEVDFGVYACSPLESSFEAGFDSISYTDSIWEGHS